MNIRVVTQKDLPSIVRIHLAAFPGFFLTRLGADFLFAYYAIYLKYGHIAYLSESNGKICGFVFGTLNENDFTKDLKA